MLACYTIICSPVIYMISAVFRNICKNTKGMSKLIYTALLSGSFLVLPLVFLHFDLGRWAYCTKFYFFVLFVSLLANKDEALITAVKAFWKGKKRYFFMALIVIYTLCLVHNKLCFDLTIADLINTILDWYYNTHI